MLQVLIINFPTALVWLLRERLIRMMLSLDRTDVVVSVVANDTPTWRKYGGEDFNPRFVVCASKSENSQQVVSTLKQLGSVVDCAVIDEFLEPETPPPLATASPGNRAPRCPECFRELPSTETTCRRCGTMQIMAKA